MEMKTTAEDQAEATDEVVLEMDDMSEDESDLPKAEPIPPEQLVALMPFMAPDPDSMLTIVSGLDSNDGKVSRLSRSILNLAMLNCLFTIVFRVSALVFFIMVGSYAAVALISALIFLALAAIFLGVEGIKTRNATPTWSCCGSLTLFYRIYICLTVLGIALLLLGVAQGFFIVSMVNFAFLCLYVRTAAQTRLLLDLLYKADTNRIRRNNVNNTRHTAAVADVSLPNSAMPAPSRRGSRRAYDDDEDFFEGDVYDAHDAAESSFPQPLRPRVNEQPTNSRTTAASSASSSSTPVDAVLVS